MRSGCPEKSDIFFRSNDSTECRDAPYGLEDTIPLGLQNRGVNEIGPMTKDSRCVDLGDEFWKKYFHGSFPCYAGWLAVIAPVISPSPAG